MITYSTNFMGPISTDWYEKRGLTEHYAGGRIDIRDDTKEGYDGWSEYALPVMHEEDWNALTKFLNGFETEEVVGYYRLIEIFSQETRTNIRWAPKELTQKSC